MSNFLEHWGSRSKLNLVVAPTNGRDLRFSIWVEQRFSAALEVNIDRGFSRRGKVETQER